ncbi:MAG: aminotransferase class I/II-fold pyridoxal phosphate-dependent enzyme [Bacteroidota bacterium]
MNNYQFETNAIRLQMEQSNQKEHSTPLFLTSSFTFDNAEQGEAIFKGELKANLYSRFSNPNVDEFIQKLCVLENAESGIGTATGMAAVYTSFASLLKQGDHIISSSSVFGNTQYILKHLLPNMGIESSTVNIADNNAYISAIKENTKAIFVETPSNPSLQMADLNFLGQLCKKRNLILIVDNCFATPYLQKPIDFGAHIVLHSATKFIDGQGRVLGGAIVGKKEIVDRCYDFLRRTGASLSPFNAWILSKSLETLALRMDRHCANALRIARFLSKSAFCIRVSYPGLACHDQFELASKQMRKGGAIVSCVLKGGKARAIDFLNKLDLFSLTANLGDSRSIATHPASTTHSKLSKEEQEDQGISEGLIRFSVGLEHIDDLLSDIEKALKKSQSNE